MRIRKPAQAVASFVGLLLIGFSVSSSGPVQVPGTYDLLVCKGPCSFAAPTNVVVKGVLVLTSGSFTPKSLNQRAVVPFEFAYSIGGDPNGCFVLDILKENQTFAGLIQFGMTFWRTHSGETLLEFYTSPDAWHFARVTMTRDGFQGKGNSSGGGPTEPDYGQDILVAKRVGEPDINACLRSAEQHRR